MFLSDDTQTKSTKLASRSWLVISRIAGWLRVLQKARFVFRHILYKILLLLCRCVRLIFVVTIPMMINFLWFSKSFPIDWIYELSSTIVKFKSSRKGLSDSVGKTDVDRSSHATWHIWLFSTANSLIFFSSPSRKLTWKPAITFRSSKMSNPVVTHQPGAGGYGTNVQTGEWSTGLCSCGSDLLVCKCSSKMLQTGIIQILVSRRG